MDLLRSEWAKHSARELMEMFPGKSRSAIIAKAGRLGLCSKGRGNGGFRLPKDETLIAKENAWLPLENSSPVTLLNRHETQCAWPLDLPHEIGSSFVCGDPTHSDKPYCTRHCSIAYLPRKARQ